MVRTIVLTGLMAMSAPVLAQTAPASPTAPVPPAAQPESAMPAAPAAPAATPTNAAGAVATIVDSEFPAYDGNKDGQLDKAEFSRWMIALKTQEMKATGSQLPADKVTAWVDGAFTTADADKSVSISKPELISYLSSGGA